jgi:hypothetical protein
MRRPEKTPSGVSATQASSMTRNGAMANPVERLRKGTSGNEFPLGSIPLASTNRTYGTLEARTLRAERSSVSKASGEPECKLPIKSTINLWKPQNTRSNPEDDVDSQPNPKFFALLRHD